ncbi:MAG: hypothetical protein GY710_17275 [Desulfobacteraceae bacterium]|nr:hypothetical protein [Desulfobacteraceae bacterium]
MEDVSSEIQEQEESATMKIVEIYDIFLTDGTHLRYCTASTDQKLMDWAE